MPAPVTERANINGSASTMGEIFRTVFVAVFIAFLIRSFIIEPFNIPSGSMKPTLVEGDYIFVNKNVYGYSRYSFPFSPPLFSGRIFSAGPEYGDAVVFRHPKKTSIDYIKRVVGLPGDTVQLIDEILYINGEAMPRQLLSDEGVINGKSMTLYEETLPNGRSYRIFEDPNTFAINNTGLYHVPEGHYFMMGDNRDHSGDSRFRDVGYVPQENLVGRAEIIFFSLSPPAEFWQVWQWPAHWRTKRFFADIH